ncbi:MAG: DcrB-related protein [Acetobacteraceae bacterium]|nr:DcrB-related protein [Acetobacteraceae bacterium]
MANHHCSTADFSFDVPEGWTNRTIVAWSAPASSSPVPPNVVVAYDRPKLNEVLGEYVNRQLNDLGKTAQGFQLELRREITFNERAAIEIIFVWNAGPGSMKQRQVFCKMPRGRVVSIATTARTSDFEEADKQFRQILRSFRWTS